ncbi:MAG: XTP/dITP diphosphatase [Armatimonadetes bacterium]|nr:XTP/dITP diphosphatase [Armatimonadota bacterium]
MSDIVLASRNPKKIKELKALLADLPVRVLSLDDFCGVPEVGETGETFAENAEIKAKTVAQATGLISVADDSGLEVDALGGQPGVYSNRFAGPDATDRDKYMRILELLQGVPDENRTARFHAAVAVATPEGETVVVEGTCEGRIAREPRGEGGFGYDPIFYLPEFGRTMAELPPDVKNQISHRAKAMHAAKNVIRRLLSE